MWNPFAKDQPNTPPAGGSAPHADPALGVPGGPVHPSAPHGAFDASAHPPGPDTTGAPPDTIVGPNGQAVSAHQPAPAPPASAHGSIADVSYVDGIAIATLTVTELSHDQGAHQLADLLVELAESGSRDFILDLHSVQFMDSACLGCLVEALNRLAVTGGRIALANGNHSVQYLFRLTRLDGVFSVCPDVMSAMERLKRRAG